MSARQYGLVTQCKKLIGKHGDHRHVSQCVICRMVIATSSGWGVFDGRWKVRLSVI